MQRFASKLLKDAVKDAGGDVSDRSSFVFDVLRDLDEDFVLGFGPEMGSGGVANEDAVVDALALPFSLSIFISSEEGGSLGRGFGGRCCGRDLVPEIGNVCTIELLPDCSGGIGTDGQSPHEEREEEEDWAASCGSRKALIGFAEDIRSAPE